MKGASLTRSRLHSSSLVPRLLSSAPPVSSQPLRLQRSYALSYEAGSFRKTGGRTGSAPLPTVTYLRNEDAKEIEDKFLKHVTPAGKDPWTYNRHLLPAWRGMVGDKHVSFNAFKHPEELLSSFLSNMTYPSELGHDTQRPNVYIPSNRPTYHWADEGMFGLPPVARVLLLAPVGYDMRVLRYAEVHWWRQTLKVWQLTKRLTRSRSEIADPIMGEIEDDDYEITREAAEYPIPPRWLFEMKKHKWPEHPPPEKLEFPLSEASAELEAPEDSIPQMNESFPHPQHEILGRPFWVDNADERQTSVNFEDIDAVDEEDESWESLAKGNDFVSKKDVSRV